MQRLTPELEVEAHNLGESICKLLTINEILMTRGGSRRRVGRFNLLGKFCSARCLVSYVRQHIEPDTLAE